MHFWLWIMFVSPTSSNVIFWAKHYIYMYFSLLTNRWNLFCQHNFTIVDQILWHLAGTFLSHLSLMGLGKEYMFFTVYYLLAHLIRTYNIIEIHFTH